MAVIRCNACGAAGGALDWRCRRCGGSLDLAGLPRFAAERIVRDDFSLWRYRDMLPVERRFSLGEGMTPLVPLELDAGRFQAKLEYLNPSGSFKDRGVSVMLNALAAAGVKRVIDNSSGNAGASLAAFAGRAGMEATVFVPAASALESKKGLIRAFGGAVVESRDYPGEIYEAAKATTYASHAWSPWFALGQMTAAWETWEQLGRRAPDAVATPVGHGGLFLGFFRGFLALRDAGLIDRLPRMIALQSAGVDPIARGWEAKADSPPAIEPGPSVADGILVAEPARGPQILKALYESDGFALPVADEAILDGQRRLARMGLLVEPTSAAPVAALPAIRARLGEEAQLVIALTGAGLKTLQAAQSGSGESAAGG